jgi:phosphopantetheinyl transferase
LNKPSLSFHDNDIEFNFTDTQAEDKAYGLFAFCQGHEVGVDIEWAGRQKDFSAIAARRFSQAEIELVTSPSGEIDAVRFLSIWTRKEAFGKAKGVGINFKMNQLNLVDDEANEHNFFCHEQRDWRLHQIRFEGLIASLVHSGHHNLSIKAFSSLNHAP